MRLAKNLDVLVLLLALPVFLIGDLSMAGYGAAAGAWLVQKVIREVLTSRAAASDDPRTTVGLMAGSMIGRGWLVALTIFAVGSSDDAAGLAAAVLVIVLFTIQFTVAMILRPFETTGGPTAGGPAA